jgi:hypothetical protein
VFGELLAVEELPVFGELLAVEELRPGPRPGSCWC